MRRTTEHHSLTFNVGDMVKFRGSGEGPYPVVDTIEIPDGPGEYDDRWPRDAVGHHQHVTIKFDDNDGTGVSNHVYSGAWFIK